jgi:hypothetical protein
MTQPSPIDPQPKNGLVTLLTQLASSGDKAIQFGILALVGLSGLGNWLTTKNDGSETRTQIQAERQQALRELHDLHNALDDFEKRQKAVLEGLQASARNQQQMLDNQGRILSEVREAHK